MKILVIGYLKSEDFQQQTYIHITFKTMTTQITIVLVLMFLVYIPRHTHSTPFTNGSGECNDLKLRNMTGCDQLEQPLNKYCHKCQDKTSFLNDSFIYCSMNHTETNLVLSNIQENTRNIILVIDNTVDLSFSALFIDLRNISRFKMLLRFHITAMSYDYVQKYRLLLNDNSFEELGNLIHLGVRLSQSNNVKWNNSVQYLKNIKTLDLSYARGLGMENIVETIKALNGSNVQNLCLRKTQLPGGDDYNITFNFIDLDKEKIRLENLTVLMLSNNGLARITPGVSSLAPNLKTLDVSNNFLIDIYNFAFLFECLWHPTLEELMFRDQGWTDNWNNRCPTSGGSYKPAQSLSKHKIVRHYTGYLLYCFNNYSKNNISRTFVDNCFCKTICKTLKCVSWIFEDMPCSTLCEVYSLMNIRDIVKLDLSCAYGVQIPVSRALRKFNFDNMHFEQGQTSFHFPFEGSFLCLGNNSLTDLSFSENRYWIKPMQTSISEINGVKGLNKLEKFTFKNNHFNIVYKGLRNTYPNLKSIVFSTNNLYINTSHSLCFHFPKLANIDVRNNSITQIPATFFKNCLNLIKIDLAYNDINSSSLDKIDFQHLPNLNLVNLSHNNINIIGNKFQKMIQIVKMRNPAFWLDLSHNRFLCNCSTGAYQSIEWIKESEWFLVDSSNYLCESIHGRMFVRETHSHYDLYDCSDIITILQISGITAVVLVITVALYTTVKLRWRIRYVFFKLSQSFKLRSADEECYRFDAYVSYCGYDRFWVHDVLMKTLEIHYGFKLCLHYRDFPVGTPVAETIVDYMSQSREVIIVLTEKSLRSDWCQFIVNHAVRQCSERRKEVIVIKLGSLDESCENSTVSHILDVYGYLEWSDDEKAHRFFWSKLVDSLYGNSSCKLPCCVSKDTPVTHEDVVYCPTEQTRLLESSE